MENTYLLRNILNKHAHSLNIFLLIWILDHLLHVLLHLLKVRLCCQYSNEQQVFALDVFVVIRLYLSPLLYTLFSSLVQLSEEEWCFYHVKNVKIVVHCYASKLLFIFSEFEYFF